MKEDNDPASNSGREDYILNVPPLPPLPPPPLKPLSAKLPALHSNDISDLLSLTN